MDEAMVDLEQLEKELADQEILAADEEVDEIEEMIEELEHDKSYIYEWEE